MRLDVALVARGLVRSRTRAQSLIDAGHVLVEGEVNSKAATDVSLDAAITVHDDRYVSRAAHKLLAALNESRTAVSGRALDAGASTGGFTQVLLERGCDLVYAVDVGHDQLDESLRDDPRVVAYEGLNLRDLTIEHVDGQPVDVVVADVSFISLTMILDRLIGVLRTDGTAVLLVKPQFEVGRERLGKGGIVRDETTRAEAIDRVRDAAATLGWPVVWEGASALPGESGNVEHILVLRHRDEQG